MSAIFYVLRKSLKNTLLELLHHPAKLILYLFVIFIVLASGISNMVSANGDGTLLDIRMLEGIYLGALLLVLIPALLMGLRSGTTFFTMSDVSLLFSAPISSKKILSYGLLKQAGTTLLLTFLLLSYGGMAIRMFGLPIWQGILLLVGFALTIPLTQMTTMTVYSYVNGNERRIKMVKTILYLLIVLLAAVVGWHIYRNGVSQDSLFAAVSSPWLEFFPVAGWMKGLLFAVFTGNVPRILLFAGLLAVGIVVCLVLFLRSDADYYEDVLQNTESTYACLLYTSLVRKPDSLIFPVLGRRLFLFRQSLNIQPGFHRDRGNPHLLIIRHGLYPGILHRVQALGFYMNPGTHFVWRKNFNSRPRHDLFHPSDILFPAVGVEEMKLL